MKEITKIGSREVEISKIGEKIIIEAEKGNYLTLQSVVRSGKDLDPEIALALLKTERGSEALARVYKGNEDKAVFLADALEGEDLKDFLDTILYKIAYSIKESELTDRAQKIHSIKSTIELIHSFLISLISSMENEKLLEIIDYLGEGIIFSLLAETDISIYEDIENEEDDLYDEEIYHYERNQASKIESGVLISPDELIFSGKYRQNMSDLFQILFENDEYLYSKILDKKLNSEKKYEYEAIKSEELGLVDEDAVLTSYMRIKNSIKEPKSKPTSLDETNMAYLLEDKSVVEPVQKDTKNLVDKTLKSEEDEYDFF